MILLVIFNTPLRILGWHQQSDYDSFKLRISQHARHDIVSYRIVSYHHILSYISHHILYYITLLTLFMKSTTEIHHFKSNYIYLCLQLRVVFNCHTVFTSTFRYFTDRHAPPFSNSIEYII
jgi:hypothetical protein